MQTITLIWTVEVLTHSSWQSNHPIMLEGMNSITYKANKGLSPPFCKKKTQTNKPATLFYHALLSYPYSFRRGNVYDLKGNPRLNFLLDNISRFYRNEKASPDIIPYPRDAPLRSMNSMRVKTPCQTYTYIKGVGKHSRLLSEYKSK